MVGGILTVPVRQNHRIRVFRGLPDALARRSVSGCWPCDMAIMYIIMAIFLSRHPMQPIQCFPPIEDADATVLILGSMPGVESLKAGRYYAHPRNAFWPIMGDLLGAGPGLDYPRRVEVLRSAGIALWDVLASCRRKGSLDSAIAGDSVAVNDFPAFFAAHPGIARVYFNGAMAEQCYRRHVRLPPDLRPLTLRRLPSTSPAHAALSYRQKLEAWRAVLQG